MPNRAYLSELLNQSLELSRSEEIPLALCMLDLDGFKAINDAYGHQLGDKLLIQVSERITALLRARDTFARLGGDEFVIVLTGRDYANREELLGRAADEMRKTEENPSAAPWEKISIAIGVALYRPGRTRPWRTCTSAPTRPCTLRRCA